MEFGYGRYDGTSMATPHVTGAVALLRGNGVAVTAIRDALMTKGTANSSLSRKTVSGKRLNVAASLGL